MKKLFYIANARMPTEKAHGIQIAKMCEAFAKAGVTVELVLPKRKNYIPGDIFSYYGVEKNFTVQTLWCLDLMRMPFFKKLWFWVESATFFWSVRRYMRPVQGTGIIYTRDLLGALSLAGNIFYEIHTLPDKPTGKYINAWGRVKGIIVISNGLKHDLLGQGVPERNVLVARDAVDIEVFGISISKQMAREKVSLPQDKKIIVYSGHLYPWKGVYTLHEAAQEFDSSFLFVFVGGTQNDQKQFRTITRKAGKKNVLLVPHQPHRDIPYYLHAADVLVIPNSAAFRIGARDTSPMKLFEYMAAKRPIVASDVPSLREILDLDMAELVEPGNPKSLSEGIRAVFDHADVSDKRVSRAYDVALTHTWQKRAYDIMQYIW